MSRFAIGQPVRIRWVANAQNEHLVGQETYITKVEDAAEGMLWFDGRPVESGTIYQTGFESEFNRKHWWWEEDQLEPVKPQGLESNEDIDKLFEPEEELVYVENK